MTTARDKLDVWTRTAEQLLADRLPQHSEKSWLEKSEVWDI